MHVYILWCGWFTYAEFVMLVVFMFYSVQSFWCLFSLVADLVVLLGLVILVTFITCGFCGAAAVHVSFNCVHNVVVFILWCSFGCGVGVCAAHPVVFILG